jgi:transcriptional regulator with XRE-family HTH domain
MNDKREYLERLIEVHERSGLSLREVAEACDLDHTYIHYILKGARRPRRDTIIALGYAYALERVEVDEILLLAGLPPIGRGVLRQFRKGNPVERKQSHS